MTDETYTVERKGTDYSGRPAIIRYAVEDAGKRWTKIPRILSNGQRTACYFVDERTREVRLSRSWKSPQPWALTGDDAALALSILDEVRGR